MADAPIIVLLDALKVYLADAATTAAYPDLAGLAINTYGEREEQYPALDVHPVSETPIPPQAEGALTEHATATLQFHLIIAAEQYSGAVRDAFNKGNALRQALNCNSAGSALHVNWIRLETMEQQAPDKDETRTRVNLYGQIKAKYAIEAR